ncbi:MAG: alpha/beta hydrolase, partial [Mycolicibacterium aromaticivorans]|nr:alpha/beta hydrolase [Mycolicibacterium aromaticivorans]
MEIRTGTANVTDDIELYYEDLGNPGDPAVLL